MIDSLRGNGHNHNLGIWPFSICGSELYNARVQYKVGLTRPSLVEIANILVAGCLVTVLF